MAKKNRQPKPNQPESSSSDDEEAQTEEGSETESESETEQQQFAVKPSASAPKKPEVPPNRLAGAQSSSSEEGSSESESETEQQQFAVKPSASAPKKPEVPPNRLAGAQSSSSEEGSSSDGDTPPRRPEKSLKSTNSEPKEDRVKASKKPKLKPIPATPPPNKLSAAAATPPPNKASAAAKRSIDGDLNGDRTSKKLKKKEGGDVVGASSKKKEGGEVVGASSKKKEGGEVVGASSKKEGEVGVADETTTKKVGVADESKKQFFQRLFTDEDEIAILDGLIEYKSKKGIDPVTDLTGFHEFIKNKLHVEVNKTQISEKVRRFKKKLEKNSAKTKNGKERKFPNFHEQKLFELSKNVWSVEANADTAGVDNPKVDDAKAKKKAKLEVGVSTPTQLKKVTKREVASLSLPLLASSYGRRKSMEEMILEDGLEIVDEAKKLELQEKWKQLEAEELQVYLKRARLIQEQGEAVLHALQGPGH